MAQVATVVITPQGSDLNIVAEIDNRPDGYNGGKSQFAWGDDVYILLHKDGSDSIIKSGATAGTINIQAQDQTLTFRDVVQFINSTEASPRVPVAGLSSVQWFGANPSPRTAQAKNSKIVLDYSGNGTPPPVGVYVGVAEVTSRTDVYKLTLPQKSAAGGVEDFQIIVWFAAEAA